MMQMPQVPSVGFSCGWSLGVLVRFIDMKPILGNGAPFDADMDTFMHITVRWTQH